MARRKVDEIYVEISADTAGLDADLDRAVNKVDRAVDRMRHDPRTSPGGGRGGTATDALEQISRATLLIGKAQTALALAVSAAEAISFYSAAFRGDWEAAETAADKIAETMRRIPGVGALVDLSQQAVDQFLGLQARSERGAGIGDALSGEALRALFPQKRLFDLFGVDTGLGKQLQAEEALRASESKLAQAQLEKLLRTLEEDLVTLAIDGPQTLKEVEARRNIFAQADKLFQSIVYGEIERTGTDTVSQAIKKAFTELELERLESKSKPPTEEEARLGVTQTVESVLGAFKTGEERQIAKNTQDTAAASKTIVRNTERTAIAAERFALALT